MSEKWVEIIAAILGTLVTALLLPYLKSKRDAALAEIEVAKARVKTGAIEAKALLLAQLRGFLWEGAENLSEQRLVPLAKSVLAGDLKDVAGVKAALHKLGADLRQDALLYFANQGIDLLAEIGDDQLDKLIRRAADECSPFPGKETAVELLEKRASNWLIERGVNWVREKYLSLPEPEEVEDAQS